ncbi:hypothetical protein [Deinococcus phoenicis]|uniref:hypothetical protein n=1 Tax=Deinococcus phoenicis TaxID=1476583 RepID=UPI00126863A5|nr:hypothetical protein [Deinococcus phoenicis]
MRQFLLAGMLLLTACGPQGQPMLNGLAKAPRYAQAYRHMNPTKLPFEEDWQETWVVPNEDAENFNSLLHSIFNSNGFTYLNEDYVNNTVIFGRCPEEIIEIQLSNPTFDKSMFDFVSVSTPLVIRPDGLKGNQGKVICSEDTEVRNPMMLQGMMPIPQASSAIPALTPRYIKSELELGEWAEYWLVPTDRAEGFILAMQVSLGQSGWNMIQEDSFFDKYYANCESKLIISHSLFNPLDSKYTGVKIFANGKDYGYFKTDKGFKGSSGQFTCAG